MHICSHFSILLICNEQELKEKEEDIWYFTKCFEMPTSSFPDGDYLHRSSHLPMQQVNQDENKVLLAACRE